MKGEDILFQRKNISREFFVDMSRIDLFTKKRTTQNKIQSAIWKLESVAFIVNYYFHESEP